MTGPITAPGRGANTAAATTPVMSERVSHPDVAAMVPGLLILRVLYRQPMEVGAFVVQLREQLLAFPSL